MKIKFRFWDEKFNCWIKEPISVYPDTEMVKQGIIIQQSTGLFDIDGKEIYEGDFIDFKYTANNYTGVVKWLDKHACFGIIIENNASSLDTWIDGWRSVKIIRNIFEQKG